MYLKVFGRYTPPYITNELKNEEEEEMKKYPKCECGKPSKFNFVNDHDHLFCQYELIKGKEMLYENVIVDDDGDNYYMCKKCADEFVGFNSMFKTKKKVSKSHEPNDVKVLDDTHLDRASRSIAMTLLGNFDGHDRVECLVYVYNRDGEYIIYKTLHSVIAMLNGEDILKGERLYDTDDDEALDKWLETYKFWEE